MQWKRCISKRMKKSISYDISKKLTENDENGEKPKFFANFIVIFLKRKIEIFLLYLFIKRKYKQKFEYLCVLT